MDVGASCIEHLGNRSGRFEVKDETERAVMIEMVAMVAMAVMAVIAMAATVIAMVVMVETVIETAVMVATVATFTAMAVMAAMPMRTADDCSGICVYLPCCRQQDQHPRGYSNREDDRDDRRRPPEAPGHCFDCLLQNAKNTGCSPPVFHSFHLHIVISC